MNAPNADSSWDLVRRVCRLAAASDRWFVGLGGSLGRLGGWAYREVDAAATDAMVLLRGSKRRLDGPHSGGGVPPCASLDGRPGESVDPRARSFVPRTELLSATVACTPCDSAPRAPIDGESDVVDTSSPSPAGVAPVLEVLGRVVSDHHESGYGSLDRDERFWALIRLLHTIGGTRSSTQDPFDLPPPSVAPARYAQASPNSEQGRI
jgi:hypothetical protein